jgi:Bacterial-like globin
MRDELTLVTLSLRFEQRKADMCLPSQYVVGARQIANGAAGFKYLVTEMVCWASGGPQQYSGRAMRESHEQLKITEAEWVAFCKDFDDTMAKFGVPDAEKNELFAIVQSTKGDIVIG